MSTENKKSLEVILFERLSQMYRDPKSMKFVLHLVRAYTPIDSKANKVLKFVDQKAYIRCALTGKELMDVDQAFKAAYNKEQAEDNREKRYQAFTGVNTNTFLSFAALQAVQLFAEDRVLNGDKRVNFIVSEERNNLNQS